jgi:hypothetical protein
MASSMRHDDDDNRLMKKVFKLLQVYFVFIINLVFRENGKAVRSQ